MAHSLPYKRRHTKVLVLYGPNAPLPAIRKVLTPAASGIPR